VTRRLRHSIRAAQTETSRSREADLIDEPQGLLPRDHNVVCMPRVLGVDDWAWRRGRRSGSVLVDLEAGRPIDLLEDRSAGTLAAWPKEHPGVEIIVRDRSPEYARGATMGAPAAQQVVDHWHVLKNVREAAERLLDCHRQDLREVKMDADGTGPRRRAAAEEARRTTLRLRAAEIHAKIHRRAADGGTISGIARDLGVTRTMVRRYLFADAPPEREYAQRPSGLVPMRRTCDGAGPRAVGTPCNSGARSASRATQGRADKCP
jgi:hypothetical protein